MSDDVRETPSSSTDVAAPHTPSPALSHGAYAQLWSLLVNWFRVPAGPPTLPTAPGERALSFRPAPAYLSYLNVVYSILLAVLMAAVFITGIVAMVLLISEGLWPLAVALVPVMAVAVLLPAIFIYVAVRLRYDTTWYVLTSRSLRVRQGIWVIRELTLTFENVQNVRLMQGPLQRFFGIASVLVETAGGGTAASAHAAASHAASIDGITNAEEIRDLILSRVRESRTAGLGDERDEVVRAGRTALESSRMSPAVVGLRELELLRAIRDELRAAPTAAR